MNEQVPENHAPYVVDAILRELTVEQCRQLIEEKEAEAAEVAALDASRAARKGRRDR